MDYKYLGKINCPDDLKKLKDNEIKELSSEIRTEIIKTVSENGGHLASNLGTVELTLALHKSFDFPNDTLIFDVGHQSYTHKLITGRYNEFSSLRKNGGLSGFMRPSESEFDPFVTGHSSNSISAAYGIAKANKLSGKDNYTVAVIGDGAFGGGMVYEAINNVVADNTKMIIVFNDNKMSISKNVGAISQYLNRVRVKPGYYNFKRKLSNSLVKLPVVGTKLMGKLHKSKLFLKSVIYNSNVFENFGFYYLGPVDGHNTEKLTTYIEMAKASHRPTVIHAITVKGKGYKYAEALPGNYHGVSPFDVKVGVEADDGDNFSVNFGNSLRELAEKNDKICAVTAAMTDGTGLTDFAKKIPERFFDVGIAEQHAVTFSAGLASKGYLPYFAVYSSFLQRGFDQIIHDAAIAELPVTLCVDRAGLTGSDGETHQGTFDVSFLSLIPNIRIYSPSSYAELANVLTLSQERKKDVWVIRYPKGKEIDCGYIASDNDYDIISVSSDIAVISYGNMFPICKNALKGEKVDHIKLNCINEIPAELISKIASYKKIYMFEDSVKNGSIGQKIASELIKKRSSVKFVHTAIDDEFVSQGTPDEQRKRYSLDTNSIKNIVLGGKK